MKALIKTNASNWGEPTKKTHQYLLANRGKWVEIDTEHLFTNQYNTIDGVRIFDKDIQEIKDDARLNLCKCAYCGNITDGLPCLEHGECINYDMIKFNKENFFISHPKGNDPVKQINIYLDHKTTGVYSFYSVNDLYYRISRRRNIEFVLVDGVPFIVGLGYTHYKKARLSNNEIKILFNCIELINEIKEPTTTE